MHDRVVEQPPASAEPVEQLARAGQLAVVEHAVGAEAGRGGEHGERRLALDEDAAQVLLEVVGREPVHAAPPAGPHRLGMPRGCPRAGAAVRAVGDEVRLHVDDGRVAAERGGGCGVVERRLGRHAVEVAPRLGVQREQPGGGAAAARGPRAEREARAARRAFALGDKPVERALLARVRGGGAYSSLERRSRNTGRGGRRGIGSHSIARRPGPTRGATQSA